MNEKFSNDELDAKLAAAEKRRETAEQEVVEIEQIKQTVQSRQGLIAAIASASRIRRAENHFGRDYEITMRTRTA